MEFVPTKRKITISKDIHIKFTVIRVFLVFLANLVLIWQR